MRIIGIVSLILNFSTSGLGQTVGVDLAQYLKPKSDTLFYNCTFDSFHALGLHETVNLVYNKIQIGSDTAYYISNAEDIDGTQSQLASFLGSAMIFKNDSVLLASLTLNERPDKLTKQNFSRVLPPNLNFAKPFELAKLKWYDLIMEVFIKDYQFEDLSIDSTILTRCLRLNLIVYDRSMVLQETVWLSLDYGIVKWIRTTDREEVLDLTRLEKYSR